MKRSILILLFCATFIQAQDGSADINWGNLPFNELNFKGPNGNISGSLDNNTVFAIAEQADGKILIGGGFFNYNTVVSPKIVRTFADGTLDTSFQSPLLEVYFTTVRNIIPLQDGRILITGQFEFDCGQSEGCLTSAMVLNSNGTINRNITEITGNLVYDSHMLPDGKMLISGSVYNQLGISNRGITRINNDGTIDTTFENYPSSGLATFGDSDVRDIEIQSDGKIIVGGNFTAYNGVSVENVVRLFQDGTLDTSFSAPEFDDDIYKIAVLADNTIYVGGPFDEINNNTQRFLAKLNANGALDTTFQPNITTSYRVVEDIQPLPNGKVMVSGNFTSVELQPVKYIARLENDGSLDTSYFSGLSAGNRVREIFLRNNGKILFGGDFKTFQQSSNRSYLAQTEANGILDGSFNPILGANDRVDKIIILPDGKLIVAGQFQEYNGYTRFGIARIFSDGSIDSTFDSGLLFAYRSVNDVAVQANGKIIATGSYISSNFSELNTTPSVVRLQTDGSLDTTFQNAYLDNDVITKIALQEDGKIITNKPTPNLSYRLNTDGTEDLSFVGPSFINIRGISIQPDGKIIFTGQFSNYLGNSISDIVRVNTDGSYDASFNVGSGSNNYLIVSLVRPNGKILVGGNASYFDGENRGKIIQLNADGSIDTSFTDTDLVSEVWDIKLSPDNKIFVSGRVFSIDGHATDGIVRLLSNGSVDTTFSISNVDDDRIVATMAIDANSELIFGGYFTNINELQRGYISRAMLNPINSDADNDGVAFALDQDPNNAFVCRDLDYDGCDDCSMTGADGSGGDVVNDGDDLDSDGLCDTGDDDIDGDTFSNQDEIDCGSDPLDATETCDSLSIDSYNQFNFKLFPNPAKNKMTIKSRETIENIKIIDLQGRVFKSINPESNNASINLQYFSNGIYFLKVKTVRGVGSEKIVIKH